MKNAYYECWLGDWFVMIVSHQEMQRLEEANIGYHFIVLPQYDF